MTAFEDEGLLDPLPSEEEHSAILEAEIERPRVGPMRDIVATIQPEQDVIVRADLDRVGLRAGRPRHRQDRRRAAPRGVPALLPPRPALPPGRAGGRARTRSFLRYIGDVLPALGEIDAQQTTIEELVGKTLARLNAKYAVRGEDAPHVATLKGDARMAEVLRRALWSRVRSPDEGLLVPRGARRWRLATYEVEEVLADLRTRGVRYGAARAMLPQRLAHADPGEDGARRRLPRRPGAGRRRAQPRGEAVRRRHLAGRRPCPARAVGCSATPTALAAAADGLLGDARAGPAAVGQAPEGPHARRAGRLADAVLIDEVADLVERTPSLGHVVADEAQDLSADDAARGRPPLLDRVRRRCWATSPRRPRRGRPAPGRTPWATSASRPPTSSSSPSASGCPARSSSTPRGCCP